MKKTKNKSADFIKGDTVELKETVSFKLGTSIPVLYIRGGTRGYVEHAPKRPKRVWVEFYLTNDMYIRLWVDCDKIEVKR